MKTDHLGECPRCHCAATRTVRLGVVRLACCWCGSVHVGGERTTERVRVYGELRLPEGVAGDAVRSPW